MSYELAPPEKDAAKLEATWTYQETPPANLDQSSSLIAYALQLPLSLGLQYG
jgi:hypothetical protein